MFGFGILLGIAALIVLGIDVSILFSSNSLLDYFSLEPWFLALSIGSIVLLPIAVLMIVKSETGQDIAFSLRESKQNARFKKFVAKYQPIEHTINPTRKDLQRFYATNSQAVVLDAMLRNDFKILQPNKYYALLTAKDPYVEIYDMKESVQDLRYGWEEKLKGLENYAEQGFDVARLALYVIYYFGVQKEGEKGGVEKNEKKALKYLNAAVKAGYVHAQEQLVWMAMDEKDYKKAESLLEKYDLKNTHVYYMYWARNYYYGNNVAVDYQKALAYYEKANLWEDTILSRVYCLEKLHRYDKALEIYRDLADIGNLRGIIGYARLLYMEFGKHRKAFKLVKREYDSGVKDDSVLFQLAYYYSEGKGCKKDIEQAISLYKILVEHGNLGAINNLATIYQGSAAYDDRDVFALYLKAAEQGNSRSMVNVGYGYLRGKGVAKDEKKAVEYFKKAADLNDESGIEGLGNCYRSGIGVPKNVNKAIELWKQAAHSEGCQYALGCAYYYDLKKYSEAKGWFLKFLDTVRRKKILDEKAEKYKVANFCLGYAYLEERQYATALEYFKVAADYGDEVAMNNIGVFYERGWSVTKDVETAKYWYAKAKANGYKPQK